MGRAQGCFWVVRQADKSFSLEDLQESAGRAENCGRRTCFFSCFGRRSGEGRKEHEEEAQRDRWCGYR